MARKTGLPSDVDVVSLREMVAPCAKQCCANKKDTCHLNADKCDDNHQDCLLHAANGRDCAWSELCSKKEKDEAATDFKDQWEKDHPFKLASSENLREMVTPCAKQCCTNKKDVCVAGHPNNLDKCDDSHQDCLLNAANGRDCAWSELCSKKETDEAADDFKDKWEKDNVPKLAFSENLRTLVEPCAKECCTNKKDFCLTGEYPASAWTTCKSSADGSNARDECCKDRMDSCIFHAANGRNCALSPLCH